MPPKETPIDKNKGAKSTQDSKAQNKNQAKKATDWDLENAYDVPTTIEDLIDLAPFKEASDTKGGYYTAASRVPTWLERKITWFIEMKGSPYQLKSDVVRDAIYLGMRVLHARHKANPDFAVEAKMSEAVSQVGVLARMREQVNQLQRGLEDLWQSNDEKQAIEGLENFVGAVVEMQDEWQRNKTLQLIKGNHVLKQIAMQCSPEVKKAINEGVSTTRD